MQAEISISRYGREVFYVIEKLLKRNGMFDIQLKEEKNKPTDYGNKFQQKTLFRDLTAFKLVQLV